MKNLVIVLALLVSSSVWAGQAGKKAAEKVINVEIGKEGFKPRAPLHFKAKESIVLNTSKHIK